MHHSYERERPNVLFCMTSIKTGGEEKKPPEPTAALLWEVAAGNREALAELYRRASAAVYGFSLSIVKDPHCAEDVMQETFLQVYAAAAAYQGKGAPMAWILAIARNLSLMKLRGRGRTDPTPVEERWDLEAEDGVLQTREDRMFLRQVLGVLSDEERQILMLHASSGLKHREIAELLGLPLATVLSKYHRALRKCKTKIKEDDRL